MSEDLDDLARTASDALVSAMVTDSWEAAERRFAELVGHKRRMDATRAALAAQSGPGREKERLAQARVWSTRLRDALDDDPGAAARLRALLADLPAVPAVTAPASQHAQADHRSQAVNVGGSISGSGEIYIGVGKVDKRRFRIILAPLNFFVRVTKKAATAHPAIATATAVVVAGGVAAGAALAPSGTPSPMASLVGSWQGTYTCSQGLTGMTLKVAPEKAGAVPVMFSFYPVPSNPAVPHGSATLRGTLSGTTVRITPVAWVVQPPGYVLETLVGAIPRSGDVFTGTVSGTGCTTFSLRRA